MAANEHAYIKSFANLILWKTNQKFSVTCIYENIIHNHPVSHKRAVNWKYIPSSLNNCKIYFGVLSRLSQSVSKLQPWRNKLRINPLLEVASISKIYDLEAMKQRDGHQTQY